MPVTRVTWVGGAYMARLIRTACLVIGISAFLNGLAFAQLTTGSITGVVTDTSGSVIPGVTVTLSGDRVMGVETRVTDAKGSYSFERLAPGTYDLRFELSGFKTLIRQQIAISAAFTATVNVQLSVGGIEESVTVSGGAPVVDTKSNVQQTVMGQDIIEGLPTGRDPWAVAQLIPGLTVNRYDVGGTQGMRQAQMSVHGSNSFNQTIAIDGMSMNYPGGPGGATLIYYDQGMFEEVNFQTSALPAEIAVGGVFLNMVTKSGGNNLSGQVRYYFADDSMQAENFKDVAAEYSFPGGNPITRTYDFNATLGGPIVKDRVWFFTSARRWAVGKTLLTTFNPDGTNAIDDNMIWNASGKVDVKLNQNHSFAVSYNYNANNRYQRRDTPPNYVEDKASFLQEQWGYSSQAKYTGIIGPRSVLQATFSSMGGVFPKGYQKDVTPSDIRREDVALSTATGAALQNYRNPSDTYRADGNVSHTWDGAGSHNSKIGVQFAHKSYRETARVNGDMTLIYNNGVPLQVRAFPTPLNSHSVIQELGFYAQDSWSVGPLTLNIGGRVDRAHGWMPEQVSGAGRWVPERRVPRTDVYDQWIAVWRVGAVYSPFDSGRTAIKVSSSRYADQVGISRVTDVNPFTADPLVGATIGWTDRNGNDFPEDDELGAFEGFTGSATTRYTSSKGPKWGYSDEITAGIEHELFEGFRVGTMYFNRRNRNQIGSVNAAVPSSAYTPVVLPNPLGGTMTVYNLDPAFLGLQDNVRTNLSILDTDYHGVDFTATRRFRNRWQAQMGLTIGKHEGGISGRSDYNDPNQLEYQEGIIGNDATYQFRLAGTYVIPRVDVTLSGTFLSNTGYPRQITTTVTRANFPGLTRASQTVYLNRRGDLRLPTVRLIDLRLARSFRVNGRMTIEPQFDIFNVTNSDTIVNMTNAAGPRLGYPSEIMSPRVLRIGFNVTF